MSELFDFTNTADLPEALQKKLSVGRVNPNIAVYANIVLAGAAADLTKLSITMIEAVAIRMDLPEASQAVIRTALNAAVKAGLIFKHSRQTYGAYAPNDVNDVEVAGPTPVTDVPSSPKEADAIAEAEAAPTTVAETVAAVVTDPLA